MPLRIHILVPVHNRREITVRFVTALTRQTHRDFHLLLIDDGSTDGTAEAVQAVCPRVDIVHGQGDWWWAGSLAKGCERLALAGVAADDVLLFSNDDLGIDDDFLARGVAELAAAPDTLLLARQIDAATGALIDDGGGVHADLTRLRFAGATAPDRVNCLPTRGLFLRWRDYERSGGLRPERLPHYLSDYEFTHRAWRRGLKLRVARNTVVRVHSEQTGRSLANLFQIGRRDRFRLLFSPRFKDNPKTWTVFVALAVSPARRPWLWLKIWGHFAVVIARCIIRPVEEKGAA